jgi:dihydroorotate dehydrogenase (NAD+) catalytic subunit
LGSFAIKGTTIKPRFGNELPRIGEISGGMINSVGLQNPGIDSLVKDIIPELKKIYHKKIVANIAAGTIKDFCEMIYKLNNEEIIGVYEINVSCPNVCNQEYDFSNDPLHLQELIKTIKPISKKPLFIKLSPLSTDIVKMAITAQNAGADGLTLINTMPGLMIDSKTAKPFMPNRIGGISGPMLKPIALRAIYLCYKVVNIPIMGCGGISNAADVLEMMYAGATAVQIGAMNLVDPAICANIIKELPQIMVKAKINKLSDIIGKAHE